MSPSRASTQLPSSAPSPDAAPHAASLIHPSAIVDAGASIGTGTRVWHWTHVCSGAVIGEGCSLGQNVFIAATARLGNNVRIQNNVSIYDGVEIDDDVFCGPSMVFTNVINPRAHVQRKNEYRQTHVGRGASIGANATIVCGVSIGPFAMIGAGSVVTRDVAPYALATGVPARRRGWVCWCGTRLQGKSDVNCPACHRRFRIGPEDCLPLDNPFGDSADR